MKENHQAWYYYQPWTIKNKTFGLLNEVILKSFNFHFLQDDDEDSEDESEMEGVTSLGGSKNQLRTNNFLRSALMTSLEAPKTNWGPTIFSDQLWLRHWRLQKLTEDQQLSQISSEDFTDRRSSQSFNRIKPFEVV